MFLYSVCVRRWALPHRLSTVWVWVLLPFCTRALKHDYLCDCEAYPEQVRIPSYIVVIAAFVTIVQLLLQAYLPHFMRPWGSFIPLIVVNCIVLGRAEAYANKNSVIDSACDGLGVGLGFTIALTILGFVRELLGSGSIFGWKFIDGDGILAFVLAPGAFIVLAYLIVLFRKVTAKKA